MERGYVPLPGKMSSELPALVRGSFLWSWLSHPVDMAHTSEMKGFLRGFFFLLTDGDR